MPAYNFKKEFAGKISDGSKRQTIRKRRKRPTLPDDILYLYTGMRTKNCQLIAMAVCTEIQPIFIPTREDEVIVSDVVTQSWSWHGKKLYKADGFESWGQFIEFFKNTYGLPFSGEIIYWELI